MGLSIRAYARHRGVSHVAVKKAIETGRITLLPDGTIDPQRADEEWAKNTVSQRRAAAQEKASTTKARPAPAEAKPQRNVADASTAPISAGGMSLLQARTINEVVKAQTNKLRLAQLKGELIDRAQAIAHVFKLARTERDAWLNWPSRIVPRLAAELDVDEHKLFVALDAAVRAHLEELGDIQPRFGDE